MPPSTIVVTGASTGAVPFTSWGCPGYDAEGEPADVAIAAGPGGSIEIQAGPLGPESSVDIRVQLPNGSQQSHVLADGGPWTIEVAEDAHAEVRPCTANDRCAIYVFDVTAPSS